MQEQFQWKKKISKKSDAHLSPLKNKTNSWSRWILVDNILSLQMVSKRLIVSIRKLSKQNTKGGSKWFHPAIKTYTSDKWGWLKEKEDRKIILRRIMFLSLEDRKISWNKSYQKIIFRKRIRCPKNPSQWLIHRKW